MFKKRPDDDPLGRRIWQITRPFLLGALPVLDLPSRYRVRRLAARLVACDPWPGMAATGEDAAQLAVLRLRWLQVATRRAVRTRKAEASILLARASVETLVVGLYCIHELGAVAQLQAESMRNLPLLLRFATDAGVIPASVLDECVSRLGYGASARGPSTEAMAAAVDKSLGARAAIDLYDRFYRPASTLSMHSGAASLLRHVRDDERLTRRPNRMWTRRTPVRIADACVGALAANLARRAGTPSRVADRYTERHFDRAVTPVIAMTGGSAIGRLMAPRQLVTTIAMLRGLDRYVKSGQDAGNPMARVAHIRAGMAALLLPAMPNLPAGALDPFLDHVAETLATETASSPGGAPAPIAASPTV